MLRSATATKQLGDSVRRCQKTESGAATAPRHEERAWGRPPAACGGSRRAATRYVRSGAIINFRRCRRSSTSTSREKNHASAARASPTGVWSKSERSVVGQARQLRNRNVLDRERIIIRTDTSSEREQNFEDGETEGRRAGRDSRGPHLEHRRHSGLHHIGVESSGKNRT